jgi:hypothetical protein
MESLFLLAFGEEEFFIAFAMACSEAFFNKLLVAWAGQRRQDVSVSFDEFIAYIRARKESRNCDDDQTTVL